MRWSRRPDPPKLGEGVWSRDQGHRVVTFTLPGLHPGLADRMLAATPLKPGDQLTVDEYPGLELTRVEIKFRKLTFRQYWILGATTYRPWLLALDVVMAAAQVVILALAATHWTWDWWQLFKLANVGAFVWCSWLAVLQLRARRRVEDGGKSPGLPHAPLGPTGSESPSSHGE